VIWTAGVKPSHLGQKLTEATGCDVDRGGRVIVNPDFSIPSHPEIRIAGDLCSYSHTVNGRPLPGMAAPAKQAGTFIGKDIAAIVSGGSRPTFRYVDFGSMAVVHASAVADLHGFKFSGRLGLLLWAIVHLALIPNRENRITLSIKWLYALATRQRASILLTGMPSQHLALDAEDAHFPMASGKGPSIAEPDAALKAAMDYYAHQLSGLPQTQELLDTKEASVADSEAAIK
jgi:NADH dehydrogenase